MKSYSKMAIMLVAGVISGVLSSFFFSMLFKDNSDLLLWIPGAIFGIIIYAGSLGFNDNRSQDRFIVFAIGSALAFFVATYSAMLLNLYRVNTRNISSAVVLSLSGLLGAIILGIFARQTKLYEFSARSIVLLALLGAALGWVGAALSGNPNLNNPSFYALFIIWQAGIALSMAALDPRTI